MIAGEPCDCCVQVSLGRCRELLDADPNAHKLPSGCHSVKGLGKMAPDSTHNHILYVVFSTRNLLFDIYCFLFGVMFSTKFDAVLVVVSC